MLANFPFFYTHLKRRNSNTSARETRQEFYTLTDYILAHLPDSLFDTLHTALASIFSYLRYKCITAKLSVTFRS